MENADQSPDKPADSPTADQPEELKNRSSWRSNIEAFQPLISVLIAVGGFLFGVLQYYDQEQKARINEQTDQQLKVQAEIRDNFNRILQFPREKNLTLSQTAFLLNDLDRSLRVSIGEFENRPENLQEEQRRITSKLIMLILDDSNFDEPRDAELGRIILENWDDYKVYLKTDDVILQDILTKYTDAFARLRGLAPLYFQRLVYNEDRTQFNEPPGASEADKSRLRHFEALLIGFRRHLELRQNDQQFTIDAVKDFQAAICNEALTKQEFGVSFSPKDDPELFVDCPK